MSHAISFCGSIRYHLCRFPSKPCKQTTTRKVAMPLPGGPADKLGNRYESWWTVYQLLRMLHGACESIRIEKPGVEKAEFVLAAGGIQEWHQAKRSHPSSKWTLAVLADLGILQGIGILLHGNADRFVFVSASDARDLAELSDRARQAATLHEFEAVFLAASEHTECFQRILKAWHDFDAATAYDILRRIEVRTIDERMIEDLVRDKSVAVYLGNPNNIVEVLRSIVQDSVHKTITRADLIEELAARGFAMRRAVRPESAAAIVDDATRRYLESVRGKLIRRTLVPRSETQTLLSILGNRARDVVLTGKAGGGKTGCVIEFIDDLRSRSIPVLALRLDRIDLVTTAEELGRKAGLEESPALVLAAAAQGREAVLIIDQLDAIVTASGRSTGFFDAVEGILRETRGLRERTNIHVIVVCREFDWDNDHRLKRLLAEPHLRVSVDVFPIERVRQLLAEAAFDPALFAPRQLELLRLPQNIALFFDTGFDPATVPVFNTAKELFDSYWDAKRCAVSDRAGGVTERWNDVIGLLVGEMTRTQRLFVPREKLDAIDPEYMKQMASEGVLTFDRRRYGFGHESFFDYCFARAFAVGQETLVDLFAADEQHLFRRSQVRQVLLYLRDANSTRYLRELHAVLADGRVRAHIKDLAFALLGSVADPSEDEWAVWEALLRPVLKAIEAADPNAVDKLAWLAWRHFFRSTSWFRFVVDNGLVASWLAADGPLANMAANLLRSHQRQAPDIVAQLLEPYADSAGDWPSRLRFIVQWSDLTTSRLFFDLTLRLIDNGVLDEARGPIAVNSTFWSMFYTLGKERPEWVPEVIARWLRRRQEVVSAKGKPLSRGDVFGHDQSAKEPIGVAATNAPLEFVRHVLPVILDLSDRAAYKDAEPPKHDALWPELIKTDHLGPDGACLTGLDIALAALARRGHDLRPAIDQLRRRGTYVSNHLLQVLYTVGADRYADEAATMLATEPWRFDCGYSDSNHWTSAELVRAIAPRCGADTRATLEAAILAYKPRWERGEHGYKSAGFASFSILSAFSVDLRSAAAKTRFAELERKFAVPEQAPRGIQVRWVGSPIDNDAAEKMSDVQWLRAIDKYRSERGFEARAGGLKGGARELARTLEGLVTRQPERFASLALRIPMGANPVYLDRVLAGLEKTTVSNEIKLAVCRKAFTDARDACGRSIAGVLGACKDTLSEEAVRLLAWLATEHGDPDHEAWQTDAGEGRTYYNGEVYTNGINTTRGHAAEAICDLIVRDRAYVQRFWAALESMVRDPSTCVRSCVAGALRAVSYHDPALALALFRQMDVSDVRLLGTIHVYEFLRALLRDHFDELRPTIERMLRSDDPGTAKAGARLAALAALHHERAVDLEFEAAAGSAPQRRGVAEVAAANLAFEGGRARCESRLLSLFNDEDEEVRKEAAAAFRELRDESLESYESLIARFTESMSYRDDSMSILYLLEQSSRRLPGITCVVCEKFLERFTDEANDIRTSRAGDAFMVTRLIFRAYHQHPHDEWTSRALDLIDRLCLEGIGDTQSALDDFER